jgi:hypothetical protein
MSSMMEEMWKFLKCSANVHGVDLNQRGRNTLLEK